MTTRFTPTSRTPPTSAPPEQIRGGAITNKHTDDDRRRSRPLRYSCGATAGPCDLRFDAHHRIGAGHDESTRKHHAVAVNPPRALPLRVSA